MTTTTMVSPVGAGEHEELTQQERDAGFDVEQLKQLVGLVEYDEAKDVFPVTGWDAIVFVVGNATQAAQYYQNVWGMELVGYSGPENGNRDHKAFVLKSGSIRFVLKGAVSPDSPLIAHQAKHGDGVVDISLEVPDVDKCIAQARAAGARASYYAAAARMLSGKPFKKEAAIAKLISSEAAMDNARDATQVFGGYGFMNEFPVARHYRDSKVLEIGEGTSEVQRMLIARGLGLPVE